MKAYVIKIEDGIDYHQISDEDFIKIAKSQGSVFSIEGFENAIKQDDFDHINSITRFI